MGVLLLPFFAAQLVLGLVGAIKGGQAMLKADHAGTAAGKFLLALVAFVLLGIAAPCGTLYGATVYSLSLSFRLPIWQIVGTGCAVLAIELIKAGTRRTDLRLYTWGVLGASGVLLVVSFTGTRLLASWFAITLRY